MGNQFRELKAILRRKLSFGREYGLKGFFFIRYQAYGVELLQDVPRPGFHQYLAAWLCNRLMFIGALATLTVLAALALPYLLLFCKRYRPNVAAYMPICRYQPFFVMFKACEQRFFSALELLEPSLEIGTETGVTTQSHLRERVTVATNFVLKDLEVAQARQGPVARHFVVCDAYSLPFRDEAFQTVISIHSFDDFPRDVQDALAGIARVLRPNGSLAFSCLSNCYRQNNIFSIGLSTAGAHVLADKVSALRLILGRNLLSAAQWQELLSGFGLHVTYAETFLKNPLALLWELGYEVENTIGSGLQWMKLLPPLGWCMEKLVVLLCWFMAYADRVAGPERNAMHLFVLASKEPGAGAA